MPNGVSSGDFVLWLCRAWPVDAGYMLEFWKRDRGSHDARRSRWHPSMVDVSGKVQPSGDDDVAPVGGEVLEDEDWRQINDLLASESPPARPCPSEQSIKAVVSLLAELRATLSNQVLPAGPVMNQLIDVWAAAHQLAPDVARPAESLLTSLVGRDLASAREISGTCDQIEAALMAIQAQANSEPVAGISGRAPRQPTGASISSEEAAR